MSAPFTLGIEEEFQLLDRQTGELAPRYKDIEVQGRAVLGDRLKPEIQQVVAELVSDIYPNMAAARLETPRLRAQLARIAAEEGLALISAGTHPGAIWQEEMGHGYERYDKLVREIQDIRRLTLIFGLHVHVNVHDREMAIAILNQARTWLPHLLALSSNSPFWGGRYTGIKSYRAVAWKSFPRSGISDTFGSWSAFDLYMRTLVSNGRIDNGRSIWWDIRPHPFYTTLEFRIFDMPATAQDTLALAALCQALVAKLAWLYRHHLRAYILPRDFIEENKWSAARDGLDALYVDFVQGRSMSMRDAIAELLDFIDDVIDDLGIHPEIDYLRALLEDTRGTGADRQIAIYEQTGSIDAVLRYLMQQV